MELLKSLALKENTGYLPNEQEVGKLVRTLSPREWGELSLLLQEIKEGKRYGT